MPFVKVWIHLVWSTKNRIPFLTEDLRPRVFQHIRENAKSKSIYVDHVSGHHEHVHCLISLGTEQTIAEVVKLIKGESSFWINKNNLTKTKFSWQHEYFAVSVSESVLDKTRDYIRNQEIRHGKVSFAAEFEGMIEKYGFQRFEDYGLSRGRFYQPIPPSEDGGNSI